MSAKTKSIVARLTGGDPEALEHALQVLLDRNPEYRVASMALHPPVLLVVLEPAGPS